MSYSVLFEVKTKFDSTSTFEVASKMVGNTKKKVDELNRLYDIQKTSIGELRERIKALRSEQENTRGTENIKKYGELINAAKEKLKELEDVAEGCKEKTESVFKSVFNANLLMKGLDMAKDAVVGFVRDSAEAYEKFNVAKTQLEQVMKNTMGEGQWGVDKIIEFTNAQEKLGVVENEVQLSGAKELGTYLKKRESLEKLIPVMNDMLAHQYGINATQESATSIAQMMGKVLDGQVNALSRNGYSFDEAQEKILKYGNESERVAVLAQVITQYVGGVNAALAKTPEGKVKQVAMEYDELKIKVGETVTKIKGDAMLTLQKFTLALYDNRSTIAAVAKVVGTATVALAGYRIAVAATVNWGTIMKTVTAAKTFMVKLFTGQLHLATRAMHAFNATQKANIIGAIVGVVAAAAAAFAMFRKRAKEASDEMKSAREAFSSFYAQERTQLETIFAKLKQTNPKSKERNELVNELKKMYPDLNKQLENEIRNTNNLSGAYDVLIGKIIQRAKTKAQEENINKLYESPVVGKFEDIIDSDVAGDMGKPLVIGIGKGGVVKTQKKDREYEFNLRKRLREYYMTGDISNLPKENRTIVEQYRNLERRANALAGRIANNLDEYTSSGIAGLGGGGSTSPTSDAITGGGKSVKNFNIVINDGLVNGVQNYFNSSSDNPESAGDFMWRLSQALQIMLNDINYAA